VCTGLSNNSKQDVITRSTNMRCSTRVFFAILNFFDIYFINCRPRYAVGRPYYVLFWGVKLVLLCISNIHNVAGLEKCCRP
jgi:hypothetical protein